MLIQLTTPRIMLDPSRFPEYIHLHTLSTPDVSTGQVLFTGVTDPEHGQRGTKTLEPREMAELDGGIVVRTFVLPFWELFEGGQKTVVHDGEIVRSANLKISRYCSAGFQVVVKSAFRSSPRTYEERTLALHMVFPATGGGVIRLGNSDVDIVNPSFDPWAPDLSKPPEAATAELRETYARAHALPRNTSLRDARVAAAEASMKAEAEGTRAKIPTLPEGRATRALPPKGEPR
jgi:hypothetical protein